MTESVCESGESKRMKESVFDPGEFLSTPLYARYARATALGERWESCGRAAGELWESCGRAAGELQESVLATRATRAH